MDDRVLLKECQRGSSDALRRIYEKYRDHLLILGIALSHDANVAEDALHDSFVAFAEGLGRFELTGGLKGYLATCVTNRVRDLMRKKRRGPMHLEECDDNPAKVKGPLASVECNEELERLSAALAALPEEQREVVVLRVHGQMRFGAIAKWLGISANTVRGRYRYGIRKLRNILDSEV